MFQAGAIVCYPYFSSGPVYGRVVDSDSSETRVEDGDWYANPDLTGGAVINGFCPSALLRLHEQGHPKSFMSFVRKVDKEYSKETQHE